MTTHIFDMHGTGGGPALRVAVQSDQSEDTWLEQFAQQMQSGQVVDLETPQGNGVRVNMAQVWAVEGVPPGTTQMSARWRGASGRR